MRSTILFVVVSLGLAIPAAAQQRPDFSGSWIASKETPSDVPAAPNAILGTRLWLQQSGDHLTVLRPVRDITLSATFLFDGSEVRTRFPGGVCQGDTEMIETATWEGKTIVLTGVGSGPVDGDSPSKAATKRVLRLQSADTLVVQSTMRDSAEGPSRPVATIYKRSTDPVPPVDSRSIENMTKATLAQVAWISGVWIGTVGNVTVEERWTPAAGGSMLATARTLRGSALASFEFLCIVERNGGLVYTALPNARTPATDFILSTITVDSATFENPKHDFPKLIRYTRRVDGSLETEISGGPKQPAEKAVLKRSRD